MPSITVPLREMPFGHRLPVLLMRLMFAGYLVYLTLLLLAPCPDPWIIPVASFRYLLLLLYPLAHGVSFTLLTVFALLAFRSFSKLVLLASLIGYAVVTELLQSFIPLRTTQWEDWFQDLVGIAVGMFCFWILMTGWNALRNFQKKAGVDLRRENQLAFETLQRIPPSGSFSSE